MLFKKYSSLLKKYLNEIGYKMKYVNGDSLYYIEGYTSDYSGNKLFIINEKSHFVGYVEEITENFWTFIEEYDYESLNHLYILANQYLIKAKEQNIKNKLKELENDFQ